MSTVPPEDRNENPYASPREQQEQAGKFPRLPLWLREKAHVDLKGPEKEGYRHVVLFSSPKKNEALTFVDEQEQKITFTSPIQQWDIRDDETVVFTTLSGSEYTIRANELTYRKTGKLQAIVGWLRSSVGSLTGR